MGWSNDGGRHHAQGCRGWRGGGEAWLKRAGMGVARLLAGMLAAGAMQGNALADSTQSVDTVTVTGCCKAKAPRTQSAGGVGDPVSVDSVEPDALQAGGFTSRNVIYEQLRRPASDTNQPGDSACMSPQGSKPVIYATGEKVLDAEDFGLYAVPCGT